MTAFFGDEEEIDRQVGNNHERHERNRAFPLEVPCPDIRAQPRDPVRSAVHHQEQDAPPSHAGVYGPTSAWRTSARDRTRISLLTALR